MGQISMEISQPAGSVLSGIQHALHLLREVSVIRGLHDDPKDPNPDGRDLLDKIAPKAGISPDLVERIRKVFGKVICPNKGNKNPAISAVGALISSNDQIEISKHLYRDVLQLEGPPGLKTCVFQNYARPPEVSLLDFSHSIAGPDEGNDPRNDWMIVRLTKPITDGAPLPLIQDVVQNGTMLITLSALPPTIKRLSSNKQPVAQICYARDTYPVVGDFPSVIQSDCDAEEGDSGSPNLVWEGGVAERHLAIAGFAHGVFGPDKNGQFYNSSTNFTYSVGADGSFAQAAGVRANAVTGVSGDGISPNGTGSPVAGAVVAIPSAPRDPSPAAPTVSPQEVPAVPASPLLAPG